MERKVLFGRREGPALISLLMLPLSWLHAGARPHFYLPGIRPAPWAGKWTPFGVSVPLRERVAFKELIQSRKDHLKCYKASLVCEDWAFSVAAEPVELYFRVLGYHPKSVDSRSDVIFIKGNACRGPDTKSEAWFIHLKQFVAPLIFRLMVRRKRKAMWQRWRRRWRLEGRVT